MRNMNDWLQLMSDRIILKRRVVMEHRLFFGAAVIKALEEYADYSNNKRIKYQLKGKSPVLYQALSF